MIRDLRASEYAGGSHPFKAGVSLLHLLLFGRISADSIGERAGSSVRIVLQNGWLRLVYRVALMAHNIQVALVFCRQFVVLDWAV